MNKTKSFNKNTKHKALYHALMESIIKDEDAMEKGVAERLKKRKPDDADKDEGPPAKPNQGLKGRRRTKAAKYDLQGIEDMVPNLWSPIKVAYNRHALLGTPHWRSKRQTFYGYASNRVSKHDVYSAKRTLSLIKVQKSTVWLDMIILRRLKFEDQISNYKLKDILNNLEMGYTSVMPRRRWSNLDKKRSRIMMKDINWQLLERRLMRSLEKFVGGREYEEDLRLL
ncbi:hypothetical protein Tco_0375346 [Tanacetum coccineum]